MQCEWKRCLFCLLPEMLHLELQVLAGFPLLLQPCCCLLGLKDLEDSLLLLHLLPEQGEPAKLHLHLTQLQSEEQGYRENVKLKMLTGVYYLSVQLFTAVQVRSLTKMGLKHNILQKS